MRERGDGSLGICAVIAVQTAGVSWQRLRKDARRELHGSKVAFHKSAEQVVLCG